MVSQQVATSTVSTISSTSISTIEPTKPKKPPQELSVFTQFEVERLEEELEDLENAAHQHKENIPPLFRREYSSSEPMSRKRSTRRGPSGREVEIRRMRRRVRELTNEMTMKRNCSNL